VLGFSTSRPIPGDTPLQELGLDSLMALELRNMLAQSFERPLSATLLFDYPTIRGLAAYLLSMVAAEFDESKQTVSTIETEDGTTAQANILHRELLVMTDAEAEELLLAELNQEAPR
jgi:acyl carrier protein